MPLNAIIHLSVVLFVTYLVVLLTLASEKKLNRRNASLLSIFLFLISGLLTWVYFAYQCEIIEKNDFYKIRTLESGDTNIKIQVSFVNEEMVNITSLFDIIFDETCVLKVKNINNWRGGIEFEYSSFSYSVVDSDSNEFFPKDKAK